MPATGQPGQRPNRHQRAAALRPSDLRRSSAGIDRDPRRARGTRGRLPFDRAVNARRAKRSAGRPDSAESGQITLLVIGFTLVLAVLIAVVVTASRVFLYQRALSTATDGAAIFAANQLDE